MTSTCPQFPRSGLSAGTHLVLSMRWPITASAGTMASFYQFLTRFGHEAHTKTATCAER